MNRSSIGYRVVLGGFAIALTAGLAVGLAATLQIRDSLTAAASARLESVANGQARAIDSLIGDFVDEMALVAAEARRVLRETPPLGEFSLAERATLREVLSTAAQVSNEIEQMAVIDADGVVVASTAPEESLTANAGRVLGDPDWRDDLGVRFHGLTRGRAGAFRLELSIPMPIADGIDATLHAWLDPDELYAITQDYTGLGETGEILLGARNEQGNAVFLTPVRFDREAAMSRIVEATRYEVPIVQAVLGNEVTLNEGVVDYLDVPVIAVTRYFPALGWGLVAKINLSEVGAPIGSLRNWLVVAGLAALLVSAIIGVWLSRSITRPVHDLTAASRRIAAGEHTLRAPVAGGAELGGLAESINAMLDRLKIVSDRVSKEQSALHQAVVETVVDGIITIDQTGTILTYNKACERIFGYEAEETIGQPVTMLMPTRYAVEHDGYLEHYMTTGEKRIIGIGREVEGKRKNGEVFPLDLAVGDARYGDKRVFVGALKDISDRKVLERGNEQKTETIRLLQRITAAANEADNVQDVARSVLQEICAFLRWPVGSLRYAGTMDRAAAVAGPVWYLADPLAFESFRECTEALEKEPEVGTARALMEVKEAHWIDDISQRQDSPRREAAKACGLRSGLAVPIKCETETVAILEFFTTRALPPDTELMRVASHVASQLGRVYERVRNTGTLKERERDLSRSNKHLEEFAYIASHDLKAPLRGIESLAQWIAEDLEANLSEESQRNFDRLFLRVKRLERLIDDLLAFSRAGRIKTSLAKVDVAAVVRAYAESLGLGERAEISISSDLPVLTTHRVPLETVFRNLIGNAVKHHDRDDPKIAVGCRELSDRWIFTVKDDGPGIVPEYQERVFGMFQTLKPRGSVEASGMGLTVVRRLVEAVGGEIWLESDPGRRQTIFSFSWPKYLKEDEIAEQPDEQHAAA